MKKLIDISEGVINRLKLLKLRLSYDFQEILTKQNNLYADIGLDREKALKSLIGIYIDYPEFKVLRSEHHTLFAAISLNHRIKSILEIGTYSASCTKLLSILFPDAEIVTMDLPDNDPIFRQTYDRDKKDERQKFIRERNSLIDSCDNVTFLQQNSLQLTQNKFSKFDLIWVDGAHGYPIIAMDIVNSLSCLEKNGFMFIDDVWTRRSKKESNYKSIGAYESILALKNADLIKFNLVPKRIEFPHGKGHMKKYIAYVEHSENVKASLN